MNESNWNDREESAGGLFLKINPDTSVRVRFVGNPIRTMESFKGGEPRPRYTSKVLVREPAGVRACAYQFGTVVKNLLADLADEEDWGSPETFDVVIKRNGSGLDTEYSVIPKAKSGITAEEMVLANKIDLVAILSKSKSAKSRDDEYDPFKED